MLTFYWWLACLLAISTCAMEQAEELLPGWLGLIHQGVVREEQQQQPWIEQVSWQPRAHVLHNLLSHAEANHIIQLSWPRMKLRTKVNKTDGTEVLDDFRTSYGTTLDSVQDDVLTSIQNRVALYTHMPANHQEPLQVLRYGPGEYFKAHEDMMLKNTPRLATMLLYLSDTAEGGETSFTRATEWPTPELKAKHGEQLSQCAKGHVAFRPRKGDGLLFWSMHPNITRDPLSEHQGCPVLEGVKWSATIWIHSAPYRPTRVYEYNETTKVVKIVHDEPGPDPGLCVDGREECRQRAARGECRTIAERTRTTCPRACGLCKTCPEGDKECYNDNRRRAHHLVFDPSELLSQQSRAHADL